VTVADVAAADRLAAMAPAPVSIRTLGRVGGADLAILVGDREARLALADARDAHERGLPEALA
jgi:hypothetical protein